ncbi:secreted protein containing LamG-like jellyroll fold [Candidatus Magnetomorum sp. HK-1]|nr:secreted protein containing LamG-like jellyroll fold [Candidatus Magnetomorum sp. HK-1]
MKRISIPIFLLFLIALFSSLFISTSLADYNNGLVAYFPFVGTTSDGSGNGNELTSNGPTLCNDRFGNPQNAYNFDGINDHMTISTSKSLEPNVISLVAWVKPIGFSGWSTVIMKSNGGWTQGYGLAHYTGSNDIHFFINNYSSVNVSASIPVLKWSHIAGVYDGKSIKLYINGEMIDSKSYNGEINYSSAPVTIGMGSGGNGTRYLWKGGIDDIRIYNRAISASEIKSIFLLTEGNVSQYLDHVSISDINGNNFSEIVSLIFTASNESIVNIIDSSTGELINTIPFLGNNWKPKTICILPDMNNNGIPEVSVMGVNQISTSSRIQIKDARSGEWINNITMPK